jgi:hypothetical protein
MHLFIHGLFNNAVSILDYIALNNMMISEWYTRRNVA